MGSREHMRRAVGDLVNQLGARPVSIAATLREYGMHGKRENVSECVIARYLQLMISTEPKVATIVVFDRALRIKPRGPRRSVTVPLAPAAANFIRYFDAGLYPALLEYGNDHQTVRTGSAEANGDDGPLVENSVDRKSKA